MKFSRPGQPKKRAAGRAKPPRLQKRPGKSDLEKLLQQSQIFDISQDAIFLWREPGGIEYWNKGASDLYGYTEKEARGRVSHDLLKTTHPVPWPEIQSQLRERGSWGGHLKHVARDGREVIVTSRHQLLPTADETFLVLESNRDVTDMERRLREQAITARFSLDALEASDHPDGLR